jgi:hypothetical protein
LHKTDQLRSAQLADSGVGNESNPLEYAQYVHYESIEKQELAAVTI